MTKQGLAAQMRALVLNVPNHDYSHSRGFELRTVPTPVLDEATQPADSHEVVLKTLYAGVCGSDKGLWFRNAFDDLVVGSLRDEGKDWRIPGHECLGEVVAMGSAAQKEGRFKVGDVVAAESHLYCGECFQCKNDERHVCDRAVIMGFNRDGCFAEYIKLPANVLWPTKLDKVRAEVGAIQEPFGNAVHVCNQVNLKGKTVLVSGCGTIGLFCFLIARELGAKKIIGIDPLPEQLELAKQLGADEVVQVDIDRTKGSFAASEKVIKRVHELTGGVGVDVSMEMAGFNGSLNNVIQSTRRGGDVILFGIKSGDFILQDYSSLVLKGKRLHSIIGRRLFETWEQTSALLENADSKIENKIYDVILNRGKDTIIPIETFSPEHFQQAMDDHIKVILKFS